MNKLTLLKVPGVRFLRLSVMVKNTSSTKMIDFFFKFLFKKLINKYIFKKMKIFWVLLCVGFSDFCVVLHNFTSNKYAINWF